MANPQIENGHIDIANELAERLAKTYLSPSESKIFWAITRKTWGWHKKMDRISFSQLEEATGINRRHIAPMLKRLIERKIVTQTGNGYHLEYGIQKDYEQWKGVTQTGNESFISLPKQVTKENHYVFRETSLPKQVTKSLPKQVSTKENKETTQKKVYIVIFDLWNSLGILKHKKLTDDMKQAIDRVLRDYSLEDVSQAIKNYAEILKCDQYYFKYSWTLKDFLRRGLEKFSSLETARQNYLNQKGGENGANRNTGKSIPGNQPAGAFSDMEERDNAV